MGANSSKDKKFDRYGKFYVYIVECADKTYYTGYTNDLEKRIREHNGCSRGAKYTRGRGQVKLVWCKEYRYLKRAMQKEIEIKKMRRYQKEHLVNGFTPNSKRLKNLPTAHFSNQSSEWHPKVLIKTFGCQMNSRDSEYVAGVLEGRGFVLCESQDGADVILFNTCSVRGHAEERVLGRLGMLRKVKKKRPGLVIGVLGCMAQSYGEELLKRFRHLDFVCGTGEIWRIGEIVSGIVDYPVKPGDDRGIQIGNDKKRLPRFARNDNKQVCAVGAAERPDNMDRKIARREKDKHAFVSIMEGCNNFCSYCIVPFVRGREQSRRMEDIVEEVRGLVADGYETVTLLGQNVSSYRSGEVDFIELLRKVDKTGIEKVRFVTSHPKDADEILFKAMRDLQSLEHFMHLPFQSGSNRMLNLMNRKYTRKDYLKKIKLLREYVPKVYLSTDVIVGFPTETEEDFKATYDLMQEVKFNKAYIFKYSPRPGTAATKMEDDVPRLVKEERNQILLGLQKGIAN